jgi:HK97 family phage portal protein
MIPGNPNAPTRRRWFRRRTEDRAMTAETYPWLVWPSSSGIALSPQASLKLAAVQACVRLLAESASTLPLRVYRGEGPDRVPSPGPLAQLLQRPSPGMTLPSLIGMAVTWMVLAGNSYLAKFRDPSGIVQLGVIPADRVAVELIGGEPFYTIHLDTGPSVHGTFDIVHLRMPVSLDGILGASPIHLARESLGLSAVVAETAGALFNNQAVPRGVLAVNTAGADNEDLMQNLSDGFTARHGGAKSAGRVAVIDASAITYAAVSLSPADAELLATMRHTDAQVARIFRVPPHLIGAESPSSMTYSNLTQELTSYHRFTLGPILTAIEQAISSDPDLCLPDEHVEFDLSRFERDDAITRFQTYAIARQWGLMSADECRAVEGLPPLVEPLPILAARPQGEPDHALA